MRFTMFAQYLLLYIRLCIYSVQLTKTVCYWIDFTTVVVVGHEYITAQSHEVHYYDLTYIGASVVWLHGLSLSLY